MISFTEHPASARRFAISFRSPCDEHCGRPASSHLSRIQLPKPLAVNGLPYSVTRNVMFWRGVPSKTLFSSGWIGISTNAPVLSWQTAILSRSEEHTSELQSLMRISYAVFCLKKKNNTKTQTAINKAKEKKHI